MRSPRGSLAKLIQHHPSSYKNNGPSSQIYALAHEYHCGRNNEKSSTCPYDEFGVDYVCDYELCQIFRKSKQKTTTEFIQDGGGIYTLNQVAKSSASFPLFLVQISIVWGFGH